MNRRSAIKTGGMALLGLGFGGCRTVSPLDSRQPRPRPALHLAPVHASWDRVLRTTVGLRPHRASGFVLRAEKLDAKTLIHNYGHAGAGMSLGWGCGILAAEFALQTDSRRAAVVGCGSPGLTTARQLQRRGFDVTIYAMTVPPDTTSNMSLAGFTPTTALVDKDRRTPAWDAQFLRVPRRRAPILVDERGRGGEAGERHVAMSCRAARPVIEHVARRVHPHDRVERVNKDRRTPAWDAQFLRVAELSYRELQLMVGPSSGVYWIGRVQRHRRNPTPGAGGWGATTVAFIELKPGAPEPTPDAGASPSAATTSPATSAPATSCSPSYPRPAPAKSRNSCCGSERRGFEASE